jgi:hypothetical protein
MMGRQPADRARPSQHRSRTWSMLSMVAGVLATAVARRGLTTFWRLATGKRPPRNPVADGVSRREAALWASLSGAVVGLSQVLARRRAASYYARSTGRRPPGKAADDRR